LLPPGHASRGGTASVTVASEHCGEGASLNMPTVSPKITLKGKSRRGQDSFTFVNAAVASGSPNSMPERPKDNQEDKKA